MYSTTPKWIERRLGWRWRLEALAEPGGICVTGMVHDHIRDKLAYPFDDMGEQSVKNIARPVRAYALRFERATRPSPVSRAFAPPMVECPPRLSIVCCPSQI
ncbi:MAG: hypothetical protein WBX30_16465 [Stellaceae bacterium]